MLPVGTALVAGEADARAQGRVLGLYQAAGAGARVVGPLLGGVSYGLAAGAPFWLGGALLALALLIALGLRPAPRPVAA